MLLATSIHLSNILVVSLIFHNSRIVSHKCYTKGVGSLAYDESKTNNSMLHKIVRTFEKIISAFNKYLNYAGMVILFFLMLLTVVDVVGRKFFNSPVTGSYELTGIFMAIMIFFGLGMAQLNREHIEIDILTKNLSKTIQHILNIIISFGVFLFLLLLTRQLFYLMQRMHTQNELSGDLSLPLYIFLIFVTIGALAFALSYLLEFLKSVLKAVDKNEQ